MSSKIMNLLRQLSIGSHKIELNTFLLMNKPMTAISTNSEGVAEMSPLRLDPRVATSHRELSKFNGLPLSIHGVDIKTNAFDKNTVVAFGEITSKLPSMAVRICNLVNSDIVLNDLQKHIQSSPDTDANYASGQLLQRVG